jgi:hypothetical protein
MFVIVTFEIDWVMFVFVDVAELAFKLTLAFGVCDDNILLLLLLLFTVTCNIVFSSLLRFDAGD